MNIHDLPLHPLAEVFTPLSAVDYAALKASIAEVGLQSPVLVTADGRLLDGVHRRRACRELGIACPHREAGAGDDLFALVIAANKARRHMTESQRAQVAADLEGYEHGGARGGAEGRLTRAQAAEAMGVGVRTVTRAAAIRDQPVLVEAVKAGRLSGKDAEALRDEHEDVQREAAARVASGANDTARQAARVVKRERRRAEALAAAAERGETPPGLHCCDIRDLAGVLGADSVDAIVTDPPYLTEHVDAGHYRFLGDLGMSVLRPGGLLIAILPTLWIDRTMADLRRSGLSYRWTIAYRMPDAIQRFAPKQVVCGWKPWAVFRRPGGPPLADSECAADVITAPPKQEGDKDAHEWGQNVGGAEAVMREWLKEQPGATVLDPYCGSGSFLVAARRLGHSVIGADVDPACVAITAERLAAEGDVG